MANGWAGLVQGLKLLKEKGLTPGSSNLVGLKHTKTAREVDIQVILEIRIMGKQQDAAIPVCTLPHYT